MIPVDYVIHDATWSQYLHQDHPVKGSVERVGVLPAGTVQGKPVVEILVRLDDSGVGVVAQVALSELLPAVASLGSRYAKDL